jgi:hypothetical protein
MAPDTRRLLLSLPEEKYIEWSADIMKMISSRSSSGAKMGQLVGCLNYVDLIIPALRHFLGRIRHFEATAYPTPKDIGRIPRVVCDDLPLMHDFLEQSNVESA